MKIHLKKLTAAAGLCAALALLTVSVFAHGGHHGGHHNGQTRQTAVSVCQIAGCSTAGRHIHSGVAYCGYDHESGFCDGSCRALCTVEGCAIAGAHSHNGVTYCGYAHARGFCDGVHGAHHGCRR